MVVLFAATQFEAWRRKVEFQEKLGSSSSNLPTKAMNRMLDAVKTNKKNREKEWTAESKLYNLAWKKLATKGQGQGGQGGQGTNRQSFAP